MGQVKHFCFAHGLVYLISGPTQSNLSLQMALLGSSTDTVIDFRWHFPCQSEKLLIAAEPVELTDAFNLKRVALVRDCLATLDIVAGLAGVLRARLQHFENDRIALKALIIRFVVGDAQVACVLQNTDYIRIARVLVNPVEGSMAQGLVLAAYVCFVHPDFDLLHRVFG